MGMTEAARNISAELVQAEPTCQWAGWLTVSGNADRKTLQTVLDTIEANEAAARTNALTQVLRGELLWQDGKSAEAAGQFEQACLGNPTNSYLLTRLGTALEAAGQLEEALVAYQRAHEASGDPVAANNVAYLMTRLYPNDAEKLLEAAEYLDKALVSAPDAPSLADTKGWLDHLRGYSDRARPALWRAVKALPASPEVHYHLGLVEMEVGDGQLGRWHLEAAAARAGTGDDSNSNLTPAEIDAVQLAADTLAAMDQDQQ